jgi:hypothetical protein
MLKGYRLLENVRIQTLVEDFNRDMPTEADFIFLQRVNTVTADEGDITGRHGGRIYAADVVADDQKAVIYEGGELELVTTGLVNLKRGERLGQNDLNRIARLNRQNTLPGDTMYFTDWENGMAYRTVQGIRMRANSLLAAMMIDDLRYARLGVSVTADWGMPTDLKPIVATSWANHAAATPVSDLLTLRQTGISYGQVFDRYTMSTNAFTHAIMSDEFRAYVNGTIVLGGGAGRFDASAILNTFNQEAARTFLSNILMGEIELYDSVFYTKNNDQSDVQQRYLPINKVLLTTKANDRSNGVWDLANAVVTETIVAQFFAGYEDVPVEAPGPIAFYTGNTDMNSPDIRCWAVQRCFPRKHIRFASAVLDTGNWSA